MRILTAVAAGCLLAPLVARTQLPTKASVWQHVQPVAWVGQCDQFTTWKVTEYDLNGQTVAQLNMDGRWSVRPWGVMRMAAFDLWHFRNADAIWLAAALPALPTEGFDAGDRADHAVTLFPCYRAGARP